MGMTHDQIHEKWDGMTPRERDAWVAEVVTGVRPEKRRIPCPDGINGCAVVHYAHFPNYTTSISAAESVLAEIAGEAYIYRKPTGDFVVSFGHSSDDCPECGEDCFEVEHQGIAQALSEAICLAAVVAKVASGKTAGRAD